jgi:hypothetical protein
MVIELAQWVRQRHFDTNIVLISHHYAGLGLTLSFQLTTSFP